MISKSKPASQVTPTAVQVGYEAPPKTEFFVEDIVSNCVCGSVWNVVTPTTSSSVQPAAAFLRTMTQTIQVLIDEGTVGAMDAEAALRLLNGAALSASLWIAAADDPRVVLPQAVEAFRRLADGLLHKGDDR